MAKTLKEVTGKVTQTERMSIKRVFNYPTRDAACATGMMVVSSLSSPVLSGASTEVIYSSTLIKGHRAWEQKWRQQP